MHDMMNRHEVQVLRRACVTQEQVAKLTGISVRSVRMIEAEAPVVVPDDAAEREKRGIGRPSKAEPFRGFVAKVLAEDTDLLSLEILRRARLDGYEGGKSALNALVSSLRPRPSRPIVRFEGLPGEFAQHDFGHVNVRFMDGTTKRIHFFASRLKFALGGGDDRPGRASGDAGPQARRSLRRIRRRAARVGLRPAEDRGAALRFLGLTSAVAKRAA